MEDIAVMTLAEMIASDDPQFAAIRAAYWAGKAQGEMIAFRHCQVAVMKQIHPLHHILRKSLLRAMSHDRAASNEHSEIMGWEFEPNGEHHQSDNPCRTIWQSAKAGSNE